jgi:hypothetical protein
MSISGIVEATSLQGTILTPASRSYTDGQPDDQTQGWDMNDYRYNYDSMEDKHGITFAYNGVVGVPKIRLFAAKFDPDSEDLTGSTCLSSGRASEFELWPVGIDGDTDFSRSDEAEIKFRFNYERIGIMFHHFLRHEQIGTDELLYQEIDEKEGSFMVQFCVLFSLEINNIEKIFKEVEVRFSSSAIGSLELQSV